MSADASFVDPADVPFEEIPIVLGRIEAVKATLWARLATPSPVTPSRTPGQLLTIPQVAAQLGVGESYLYEQARLGKFPCVRMGRYVRVDPQALETWLADRRKA